MTLFAPAPSFAVFGVGDIVHDPINAVINRIRDAMATAHEAFMKIQMVQDAKVLYDNYVQGKRYYDEILRMSKHEGGFLGYVESYATEQMETVKREQENLYEQLKEGDSKNYLSEKLQSYDNKVVERINNFGKFYEEYESYGEQLKDSAQKRDQEIVRTYKDANKPMDEKGVREIQVRLAVHQTQLLQDMTAMMRQQQLLDMKRQKDDIQREKESLAGAVESMKGFWQNTSDLVTGQRKNPFEELRKLPSEK